MKFLEVLLLFVMMLIFPLKVEASGGTSMVSGDISSGTTYFYGYGMMGQTGQPPSGQGYGTYPICVTPSGFVRSGLPKLDWYQGKTSTDGYVLEFDEQNCWWYWRDMSQVSTQAPPSPQAPSTPQAPQGPPATGWYEGKTSGDGYVLQYDEEKGFWYWEDTRVTNLRE